MWWEANFNAASLHMFDLIFEKDTFFFFFSSRSCGIVGLNDHQTMMVLCPDNCQSHFPVQKRSIFYNSLILLVGFGMFKYLSKIKILAFNKEYHPSGIQQ